jgi:hypothetical protein
MRILLLFLLPVLFSFHPPVVKVSAHAYVRISSPGAMRVDEDGNPLNTFVVQRFIILETPGNGTVSKINVKAGSTPFHAQLEEIRSSRELIGKHFTSGKSLYVIKKKNMRTWRITLTLTDGKQPSQPLNKLCISGMNGSKSFRISQLSETQLESVQFQ